MLLSPAPPPDCLIYHISMSAINVVFFCKASWNNLAVQLGCRVGVISGLMVYEFKPHHIYSPRNDRTRMLVNIYVEDLLLLFKYATVRFNFTEQKGVLSRYVIYYLIHPTCFEVWLLFSGMSITKAKKPFYPSGDSIWKIYLDLRDVFAA